MSCLYRRGALLIFVLGTMLSGASVCGAAAGTETTPSTAAIRAGKDAKGILLYKARSAALKYAWLVKGPYSLEPGKTVRRLILSATDLSGELQACKTIMCADGRVTEGVTVDFDVGPRLNYWIALDDQKVQYSGTAAPDAFDVRANDATHLAGRLAIDDVAAGGPRIDVEFNVTIFKEFGRD